MYRGLEWVCGISVSLYHFATCVILRNMAQAAKYTRTSTTEILRIYPRSLKPNIVCIYIALIYDMYVFDWITYFVFELIIMMNIKNFDQFYTVSVFYFNMNWSLGWFYQLRRVSYWGKNQSSQPRWRNMLNRQRKDNISGLNGNRAYRVFPWNVWEHVTWPYKVI